jgi:hypothetical protein
MVAGKTTVECITISFAVKLAITTILAEIVMPKFISVVHKVPQPVNAAQAEEHILGITDSET